jgi:hypothetical protein
MGGKGGDDGGFVNNAQQNSGPVVERMATDAGMQPAPAPVAAPVIPPTTTMPTQGDDAKTPGDGSSATPGSGASTGSGGGTGSGDTGTVAAQTLSAPQYWFNQPVSTLSPKAIPKKGGSMKTTKGGSV